MAFGQVIRRDDRVTIKFFTHREAMTVFGTRDASEIRGALIKQIDTADSSLRGVVVDGMGHGTMITWYWRVAR